MASYLLDLTPVELLEDFYKRNFNDLLLMRESRQYTHKALVIQLRVCKRFREAINKLKS